MLPSSSIFAASASGIAPLRAAALALSSCACFMAAGTATKMLAQNVALPATETALLRLSAGLLVVLWGWSALRAAREPWLHALRGTLGAVALLAMMHSYTTLPLFLATTLFYSRVLLMVPIARLFLGERADRRVWAAALIGFAGVLLALSPRAAGSHDGWAIVVALTAAAASAGSQVTVRRLAQTNPPDAIVLIFTIFGSLALAPFAATSWVTPAWSDAWLLVAIGLGGVGAQLLLARAYRWGSAAFVGQFAYVEIPLSAAVGALLAAEVPELRAMLGAAVIVAATWYATRVASATPS